MKRVVIFGECMVELVGQSEERLGKSFAGDTYNTAVYLKRCAPACTVSYFTAIGTDFLSDELLLNMSHEHINADYVFRDHQRNLGLYMIKTDSSGERTFAYWRKDSAATQTLNQMAMAPQNADLFYFSGISLAILDDEQRQKLFSLVQQLKNNGCKVGFDPNYRARLWQSPEQARHWIDKAYRVADIAFPGGDDHQALYGHKDTNAIFAHLEQFNITEVVSKNGAAGVHILSRGERCFAPVETIEKVVDTTAAGDAFNGGYLAARLSGKSPMQCAGYGNRLAAVVIGYPGAIIKTKEFSKHKLPLTPS